MTLTRVDLARTMEDSAADLLAGAARVEAAYADAGEPVPADVRSELANARANAHALDLRASELRRGLPVINRAARRRRRA